MKDSGIKWIGEIPEKWGKCRLKNVITIENGKEIIVDGGNIPVYGSGGIFKFTDRPIFVGQSLLMGRKGTIDKPMLVDGPFWTVDTMFYTSRIENINARFLYYACSGLINFDFYKSGSVLPSMTQTELYNVWITLPGPSEQQAIAAFLDKKCFVIDNLISNETKQIEKLKEYRQAIITKAVTKGLDPNAPMKDSGVEWIGEIPENWSTIRIKNVSWLKGRIGWDGLKSSEFIDSGPYLITGTDFSNGSINWKTCAHISEERYLQDELLHIKENDLLITKDGTIGKLAIVKNCPEKVSLNSGVMIIRNDTAFKYSNRYLYYVLQSNQFLLWYELSQSGNSTIKHLYQAQFYNFEFSYPSLNEQSNIANYLDERCSKIDFLLDSFEQKISKLKAYKLSLIYEYVTGKKRVSL